MRHSAPGRLHRNWRWAPVSGDAAATQSEQQPGMQSSVRRRYAIHLQSADRADEVK